MPVRISLSGCTILCVQQLEMSSAVSQARSEIRLLSVRPSFRLEQHPAPPTGHILMSFHGDINQEISEAASVIAWGTPTVFPRRAQLCHSVVIGGPAVFDKHVTSDRNVMCGPLLCRDPCAESQTLCCSSVSIVTRLLASQSGATSISVAHAVHTGASQ